jgi:hypothetical protein
MSAPSSSSPFHVGTILVGQSPFVDEANPTFGVVTKITKTGLYRIAKLAAEDHLFRPTDKQEEGTRTWLAKRYFRQNSSESYLSNGSQRGFGPRDMTWNLFKG